MQSQIDPGLDSPISISPMARHGVIEVDAFCTGCHYNLHGQVITIDERLGFPVCRCPECGKYHPAGTGVTAAGVWVRRFASILLFSWISTVLSCVVGTGGAMAGLDGASVGICLREFLAAPDGTPVDYKTTGYVLSGTNIPAVNPSTVAAMRPWTTSPDYGPGLWSMIFLSIGSAALGFLTAVLCVSLLWHWPKRRYFWILLITIIPACLVMIPFLAGEEFRFIRLACLEHISTQAGFQGIGMLVGVLFGRPLARQIARTIIPPKPLQMLAFLWMIDGKTMPAVPPALRK